MYIAWYLHSHWRVPCFARGTGGTGMARHPSPTILRWTRPRNLQLHEFMRTALGVSKGDAIMIIW